MGVIKNNPAKVGLFETSSEESLHIPQQSDDDCSVASLPDDEPLIPAVSGPPLPRRRLPVPTWHGDLRRNFGRKRLRRRDNVHQLMTLVEEEELSEVTFDDLVPTTNRGFVHILNDESAYQVWNDFVQSSEETQEAILQNNTRHRKNITTPLEKLLTGNEAFSNIKTGLRNKLKKTQIPQGMVDYFEKNVVDFFTETPTKTFISDSVSSFERLILHAISQYHRLVSHSVDSESEQLRLVRVYNPYRVFQLPEILLGQYLILRKKTSEPATNGVHFRNDCGITIQI